MRNEIPKDKTLDQQIALAFAEEIASSIPVPSFSMFQPGKSSACLAVLKGLISAVCVTLPGMALIAVLAVYASLSDGALTALNQILKLTAIFIGAYRAVGRGGTRGLALGGAVGLIYIALGYGICALWDGALITGGMLALEFLAGLTLGGISGALTANLPSGKGRMRKRTA